MTQPRIVPDRRLRALPILFLATWLSACDGGGSGAPDSPPPTARPQDGLVADAALQAIVDLQVARDGAGLIAALEHDRPEVRARAALALASVQEPGALPKLAELAADDMDPDVRRDAVLALGQLDRAESVPVLTALLAGEEDPSVRLRVIEALGKTSAPAAGAALVAAEVGASEAGPRALALSVNAAVKGMTSQPGIEFLLSRLDSSDPAERRGAAYYFGRTDTPAQWSGGINRVRTALDGYAPGDPAAMYLVQALGKAAQPDDRMRLERWAVEATDWRTRSNAMAALRGFGGEPSTVDVLLAGLDDPAVHVVLTAASSLEGQAQPPTVVQRMIAWLDANPDNLLAAEPVLRALAAQNEREPVFTWVDGSLDDPDRLQVGLRAILFLQGEEALGRLTGVAESPDSAPAAAAIQALGRRWAADRRDPQLHERYFQVFRKALTNGNADAEFAAGQALTDPAFRPFGSSAAYIEAFGAFQERGDPVMASEMLRLVALAEDPLTEGVFRDALGDEDWRVRFMGASGLERLTGEVIEVETPEEEMSEEAAALPYDPTVIDWGFLGTLGARPRLTFETTKGRIVFELAPEEAPQTVQTMVRLAAEGRFDDTPFHRVIANFVAQGGDVSGQNGRGGAGFSIRSEFNGLPYVRGALGMASAGKDTESSQFFIAHTRLPHLDGGYTVFGWVVDGIEVVDAIVQGDRIVTASFTPGD